METIFLIRYFTKLFRGVYEWTYLISMSTGKYYPQLDTLRTLAAFAVINLHWLSSDYPTFFGISRDPSWEFGHYGVQLFFVLSGFLITDILIRNRAAERKSGLIIRFYLRRALRLFPLYYLMLIYLLVVRDQFVIDNFVWFITYAANIRFYLEGGLVDVWSNHLWTLSVEEQFYLIFPLVLLFLPRRWEFGIPCTFIAIALLFKHATVAGGEAKDLLTIAQTDMLGAGILLAVIRNRRAHWFTLLTNHRSKWIMVAALVVCVGIYQAKPDSQLISFGFNVSMLVGFGLLVANTVSGFSGLTGMVFNNKALQYLGRISYGMYVYHKVIPLTLLILIAKLGIEVENLLVYYIINLAVLITISHLSWKFFERPLMELKSKFEYQKPALTNDVQIPGPGRR